MNYDEQIEQRAHPENFDRSITDAEIIAERREALTKKLFKQVYGAMIDEDYCSLTPDEIGQVVIKSLTLFNNRYLITKKVK